MESVKYSVLMSVYIGEEKKYLQESIESMVKQSLEPDEIIIVIDGPIDSNLKEVIDYYVDENPELFTIIPLEKNVGLGQALNYGLEASRNELVARMDTDDISTKKRCEIQIKEFLNDKSLDIIGTHIDEFYDSPNEIVSSRIVPLKHDDIVTFSKRRNPFNHPSVMYKKTTVLNNGGYSSYRRNQDLDLFVRMLNNGAQAKNIDKSLLLFRANKDNFKRRKSWEKCSSYIRMAYSFWRKGYSNFSDFMYVAISQLFIFISPIWVLDFLTNKYLRKAH